MSSRDDDVAEWGVLPENVPLGGTVCLLSCLGGGGIRRLSMRNGTPNGEKIGGRSLAAVQISENEIATVSSRTPKVSDVVSGREIATLVGGHWSGLFGVAFLPRSQLLVTGGNDKTVVVWNQQNCTTTVAVGDDDSCCGEEAAPFAVKCHLEGHSNRVWILDAWGEEERNTTVVSGSWDTTARVWDVLREKCVSVLQRHRDCVFGLCHDSEKQIQFTGSYDHAAIAWDFRLSQHQEIVQMTFPNFVTALCYRSKRSQLIVSCFRGFLRVIDIRMLRSDNPRTSVVHEWDTQHFGNVRSSCDVPDDNWDYFVTSGSDDNHVKAWKENGRCVWDWEAPPESGSPCGIHPFIRGDPCCRFEQENDEFLSERCAFMLEELGCFPLRIRLVSKTTEDCVKMMWKWVLLC